MGLADEVADGFDVEERAEQLVRRLGKAKEPLRSILREIALVLDHLDRLRVWHRRQARSLVRVECYVDTELMRLERRQKSYTPGWPAEREKLQRRLFQIDRERTRLSDDYERDRRVLIDRLHQLVTKHDLIRGAS